MTTMIQNIEERRKNTIRDLWRRMKSEPNTKKMFQLFDELISLKPEPHEIILALPINKTFMSYAENILSLADKSTFMKTYLEAMRGRVDIQKLKLADTVVQLNVIKILVRFGHLDILKRLSKKQVKAIWGRMNIMSLLSDVLEGGHYELADWLVVQYIQHIIKQSKGTISDANNALFRIMQDAIAANKNIIVKYLLEQKGADPNHSKELSTKPFVLDHIIKALDYNNIDIIITLLMHGAELRSHHLDHPSVSVELFLRIWLAGLKTKEDFEKIIDSILKLAEKGQASTSKTEVMSQLLNFTAVLDKINNYIIDKKIVYDQAKALKQIPEQRYSLANYPDEILLYIHQFLDDPIALSGTSLNIRELAYDENFWRTMFSSRFNIDLGIRLPTNTKNDADKAKANDTTKQGSERRLNYLKLYNFYNRLMQIKEFIRINLSDQFTEQCLDRILTGDANLYQMLLIKAILVSAESGDFAILKSIALFVDLNKYDDCVWETLAELDPKQLNSVLKQLQQFNWKINPRMLDKALKSSNIVMLDFLVKHFNLKPGDIPAFYEQQLAYCEFKFDPYQIMSKVIKSNMTDKNKIKYLGYLIEKLGFDPKLLGEDGSNLLHQVNPDDLLTLRYLLSLGLDPNVQSKVDGHTVLTRFCSHDTSNSSKHVDYLPAIKELLCHGAKFRHGLYNTYNPKYSKHFIYLLTGELFEDDYFVRLFGHYTLGTHNIIDNIDYIVGEVIKGAMFYQPDGVNIFELIRQRTSQNIPVSKENVNKLSEGFYDSLTRHLRDYLLGRIGSEQRYDQYTCHSFNVLAGFLRLEAKRAKPFNTKSGKNLKLLYHLALIKKAQTADQIKQVVKLLKANYGITLNNKQGFSHGFFNSIIKHGNKLNLVPLALVILAKVQLMMIRANNNDEIVCDEPLLVSLSNFSAKQDTLGVDKTLTSIHELLAQNPKCSLKLLKQHVKSLWSDVLCTLSLECKGLFPDSSFKIDELEDDEMGPSNSNRRRYNIEFKN